MRVTIFLLVIFLISCNSRDNQDKQVFNKTPNTNTLKELIPVNNNENEFNSIIKIDSIGNYYLNENQIIDSNLLDTLSLIKNAYLDYKVKLITDNRVKLNKIIHVIDICNKLKIKLELETK